jgi:hypothetical protein
LVLAARQAPPPAPAQQNGGGSILGGIGSTIAQGDTFGYICAKTWAGTQHCYLCNPCNFQAWPLGLAVPWHTELLML